MTRTLASEMCRECGAPITTTRSCKSKRAGLCSKCFKRLYDRSYRQTHKDRYKEYAHKYYESNREKLREKNTEQKRVWRAVNRTHYREYQRNYKRHIRNNGHYDWQELPTTCGNCGTDIADRWATKSRREGFCPACYRRKAQAEYYNRKAARQRAVDGQQTADDQLVEISVSQPQLADNQRVSDRISDMVG